MAAKPNPVLIKILLHRILKSLEDKAEFERAMAKIGVKNTRIN